MKEMELYYGSTRQTKGIIPNNKLDIIICGNKEWTCRLTSVADSGNRNALHTNVNFGND